jgi:transposase
MFKKWGLPISQEGQFITNKIKKNSKNLKKTLVEIKQKKPHKPILYFDESRFGTKTKTGLAWYKKGSRTRVKVKLGFENFYLYSSVNPQDGSHFTLLLPWINTDGMNLFMEELSKEITKDVILIMDGAGWHKSKDLKVPKNIEIVLLPPYCPELNPVERLWRYIKDHTIRNKVFDRLLELENEICEFVKNLTVETILKTCG